MLLPVVTLIVLLVTRRRFDQTADRRAVRKLTTTLTTALSVSCGAFVLLAYLLRDHFSPRPEFGVLAQDLPVRFLPGRLFSNRFFLPAGLAGQAALRVGLPAVLDRGPRRAYRVLPAHLHLSRRGRGGPGPRHPHPRRLDAVLHVDLAGKPVLVQPGRPSRRSPTGPSPRSR